jgi:NADPH-dependent curcumin reductase CurA
MPAGAVVAACGTASETKAGDTYTVKGAAGSVGEAPETTRS